jgi:hypothetical protein
MILIISIPLVTFSSRGEGFMIRPHPDTLQLTKRALRALMKLNLFLGACILALLIASLIAEAPVMHALGARSEPGHSALFLGMRLIMLIGLCGVPVAHLALGRLLSIVETVGDGDPFVLANAARLRSIAWLALGLEALHFAVRIVAASVSTPSAPLNLSWEFSFTRLLSVLLLFVLARVFEHGAQMREELGDTV